MSFDTIPSKASFKPKPFNAHVSDEDLRSFQTHLKYSRIGPKTYENLTTDVKDFNHWGISRQWVADAKQHWETKYDWRKTEDRINSYPNFTVPIQDSGFDFQIHFVALFSKKPDAVPLALLHGWPGSFLEFLGTLDVLREKYKPEDLPFHVIVPSLPGYGYSNGPPLDKDFNTEGIARVVDKLMVGLGFGDGGYVAQGGDVGSFVARVLGVNSEACKAVHCKVGEKFLQWSDESPPVDEILDSVTLYWFTDSFPRAIYPYRQFFGPKPTFFHPDAEWHIKKPMGYSWHPKELAPVPKDWVAKTGNLVWYRGQTEGGHFAAMEKPKLFVKDVEDFVKEVWPTVK
ncbi:hypothetical protein B0A54_11622 [Friedmanniomyces endolithicus]|uniref:Epoxide hydrolase N-terminal domain-containing protein n=1 Tax=Friedmanniomyces endolithicus TaxID=329885 RepID=A0A4U0UN99_9PEZI|nr:hypothetical protein B0A54_11622 [Friedmanniomyces endolithicus]